MLGGYFPNSGYSELLKSSGFHHYTVNHTYYFVDPTTGAHTQTIERLWGSTKWRNKNHRGTARHHLDSYLIEFVWRQNLGNDPPFNKILMDIKTAFLLKKIINYIFYLFFILYYYNFFYTNCYAIIYIFLNFYAFYRVSK
jgi:hypothetical protein